MTSFRRPQHGMILLGLMLVLVLGTSFFLLRHANITVTTLNREAKTIAALTTARDALVARAMLDLNHPGSLPCPDIKTSISGNNVPGDGKADVLTGSACPAYAGWLPWRTLDLNDPRDATGESFWYVLSPNFNDGSGGINSSTPGTLFLDGHGDIVALIIAPGGALSSQSRPSHNIADYLDDRDGDPATSNRDGDNRYFTGSPDNNFNDRIVALDRSTLMAALAPRILGEIRQVVRAAGGVLPFADGNGDGIATPSLNKGGFPYSETVYDLRDPSCRAATPPASCAEPWYTTLKNNGWFPFIVYDRTAATLTLDEKKKMNLP